jgi:hypothetical protein
MKYEWNNENDKKRVLFYLISGVTFPLPQTRTPSFYPQYFNNFPPPYPLPKYAATNYLATSIEFATKLSEVFQTQKSEQDSSIHKPSLPSLVLRFVCIFLLLRLFILYSSSIQVGKRYCPQNAVYYFCYLESIDDHHPFEQVLLKTFEYLELGHPPLHFSCAAADKFFFPSFIQFQYK